MEKICKICKNSKENNSIYAREMMFGTREEFEYFKCHHCGCIQILIVPENLEKYYPDTYYSFHQSTTNMRSKIRRYLRRSRSNYFLTKKGVVGKLLKHFSDDYFEKKYDWDWFRKSGTNLDSNILDVGCGTGKLLSFMDIQGFSKLSGADLYIEKDIKFGIDKKYTIYKKPLSQLEGNFDLIMLHHSLEHMDDQISTMKEIHNLLKSDGFALIRVPVSSSFAWEKYNTDWVQFDAPRHFFLHSITSIGILAQMSGFEIMDVVYDSTEFQFIGSELYKKNIPLIEGSKMYLKDKNYSIFTKQEIEQYANMAKELNIAHEGDQACFFLKKVFPFSS